jgi:hypothetical protein
MARELQYVCDFCNEVVGGTNKRSEVKATYFQIKGSVCLEYWDEPSASRRFFYITDRRDDELTFCRDKSCFADYISMKEGMRTKLMVERNIVASIVARIMDSIKLSFFGSLTAATGRLERALVEIAALIEDKHHLSPEEVELIGSEAKRIKAALKLIQNHADKFKKANAAFD